MPTWGKMSIFTWEETSYFKWSEVGMDTLHFAQLCKEKELSLPDSVKEKVLQICKDEYLEYSKILGKSIQPPTSKLSTVADVLGLISFLERFLDIPAITEMAVQLHDLLLALVAGQL